MSHIHAHGLPPLPALSRFPELNVRTYVTGGDKPGVYFFSLDAANRAAVWAARRFYCLPYFHARMSVDARESWMTYEARRYGGGAQGGGGYSGGSEGRRRGKGVLEDRRDESKRRFTGRRRRG